MLLLPEGEVSQSATLREHATDFHRASADADESHAQAGQIGALPPRWKRTFGGQEQSFSWRWQLRLENAVTVNFDVETILNTVVDRACNVS